MLSYNVATHPKYGIRILKQLPYNTMPWIPLKVRHELQRPESMNS